MSTLGVSKRDEIAQMITSEARHWLGVRERGGANRGPEVEAFQKAVDGKAQGEPWCMAFVQYVIDRVCERFGVSNPLPQSEHCLTVFFSTDASFRSKRAEVGFIAIWQMGETPSGHTGIVIEPGAVFFRSVEGNTNDAGSREGDGVYEKRRAVLSGGKLQLRGFINAPALILAAVESKIKTSV